MTAVAAVASLRTESHGHAHAHAHPNHLEHLEQHLTQQDSASTSDDNIWPHDRLDSPSKDLSLNTASMTSSTGSTSGGEDHNTQGTDASAAEALETLKGGWGQAAVSSSASSSSASSAQSHPVPMRNQHRNTTHAQLSPQHQLLQLQQQHSQNSQHSQQQTRSASLSWQDDHTADDGDSIRARKGIPLNSNNYNETIGFGSRHVALDTNVPCDQSRLSMTPRAPTRERPIPTTVSNASSNQTTAGRISHDTDTTDSLYSAPASTHVQRMRTRKQQQSQEQQQQSEGNNGRNSPLLNHSLIRDLISPFLACGIGGTMPSGSHRESSSQQQTGRNHNALFTGSGGSTALMEHYQNNHPHQRQYYHPDQSTVLSYDSVQEEEEFMQLRRLTSWATNQTTETDDASYYLGSSVLSDSTRSDQLAQTLHYDDDGNLIHPKLLESAAKRRLLSSSQRSGRTRRVQFEYPPISRLRECPRPDPNDLPNLFFTEEELDEIEADRNAMTCADDVEIVAVQGLGESSRGESGVSPDSAMQQRQKQRAFAAYQSTPKIRKQRARPSSPHPLLRNKQRQEQQDDDGGGGTPVAGNGHPNQNRILEESHHSSSMGSIARDGPDAAAMGQVSSQVSPASQPQSPHLQHQDSPTFGVDVDNQTFESVMSSRSEESESAMSSQSSKRLIKGVQIFLRERSTGRGGR